MIECHVFLANNLIYDLDNADVWHKYAKMYFNTKQLPALPFYDPYSKPHGARGLSNNYNLCFYPKLGNGVCVIRRISCACVVCKSMLEKPLISGIP